MRNLIRLVVIGIFILSFPACGSKDKEYDIPQKAEEGRIFALYLDSTGKWIPTLALRVIQEGIKLDSVKGTKSIAYDSIYGVDRLVGMIDNFGNPIMDSATKKQKLTLVPIRISKDSIRWRGIEGVIIDSLDNK